MTSSENREKQPIQPAMFTTAQSVEKNRRLEMVDCLNSGVIPKAELLQNLGIFMPKGLMAKHLLLNELYLKMLSVQGVILEFGCRWGQNLAGLVQLRAIHEPTNFTRQIIGFDTFSGFNDTHEKDGEGQKLGQGAYGVTTGYRAILENVLSIQESYYPESHLKKFTLVEGDVRSTLGGYLNENPQTIISLAIFDMDLYEPTRFALQAILPYLTRGSILVFDELNCKNFPGETVAYKELIAMSRLKICRSPLNPYLSWIEFE